MNTSGDLASVREDPLPELPDARIAEIEEALFAEIGRDRGARRARRGRWWIGGAAAAAVVVVAAIAAPMIVPIVSPSGGSSVSDEAGSAPVAPEAVQGAGSDSQVADGTRDSGALESTSPLADPAAGRDIITTASATVVVDDVPEATARIGAAAEAAGGYVESMSIGQNGQVTPVDPGVVDGTTYPYPYPTTDGAWITVRVPADRLTATMDDLSQLGEVTASSINRQDVTEQTIDLQARIDATQASVDRLTALMAQAGDLSDLIAAETALSERQATLESYQQQLKSLDGQVAMSTLTVTLSPVAEPVEADPAGFTDGLIAGWNGLVATLNGIVIALGFLIPWLVLAAVVALLVWAVVRIVRRRRADRRSRARAAQEPAEEASPPRG
ncbi:DUF4349 domain-containing protein [Microbacterium sp. 4R-513]|uniref:DUF4349 domain-containing protein n=1 Tax=Microbacterium sp. 4R-513 TaxID=2567934 RepID=UPI0013E16E05|nr:DUF4349 domain-containing protein [Microbacterium sp. 4R-513]QIG40439.1 DUF4349 domain-containing protein [Microbacterium sp. 4R-513]